MFKARSAADMRGATVSYTKLWDQLELFTPAETDMIPLVWRHAVAGVVTAKHWESIIASISKRREAVQ